MFGQEGCRLRLEWGGEGIAALGARCAVLVVVDVLSFTTATDVVVARGGSVRPVRWVDRERAARPADPSWSLRPSSLVGVPAGVELELPSPNGATLCAMAADTGAIVLAACLRNARAVAEAASSLADGGPIGVVPAGERWGIDVNSPRTAAFGPLRPAVEDLLGAGAVVSALLDHGSASVEAGMAAEAYRRTSVADAVAGCVSGRELIAAGHAADVALACEVDVSTAVPRLVDGVLRPT
ncbi:2-phosphosulfolactate phosphatase [Saccharothrix longispora]|uniref:2-phosphosulfolactate phosphatase n=1 Tax=Saccharothrix longispora TaxID=33920 RepID=UPI0028FDBA8F|nr:2-phosphosulfolactate phosphatase [Saccharothrix longispora]MBY8851639.1 2-phosphosulfolactate phosphatase [Saccharothrix sp. MB29]MDU0294549.1 2-phosphosulfolactate phosphatase [Saccharothrix longispora]